MFGIRKSFLIVLVLMPLFTRAKIANADNAAAETPFIEVVGTAIKEMIPDRIFISISLSDKANNNKEKYDIKPMEDRLRATLIGMGFGADKLVLSDGGSEIIKDKRRNPLFEISKQYILEVKTAADVNRVIKELYAIDIKECAVIKAESTTIESLRKEVRIAAIKAAKEKAQYLVEAIGEQLGKPMEIREQPENYYGNVYQANVSNVRLEANQEEVEDVDFKKTTIKFSYYIKYAIK